MRKIRNKILYHGVHISISALMLLTFALAFPATSENSFAEPITLADNEAALVTTDIDVKSAISLATKQQLAFEINPHSSGSAFGKGTTTINVVTNTDAGYNLYIHTTSENGQLHNKREGITDVLEPMAKAAAPESADFANNTWGYSLDGTTYQAVPTTSTKVPGSEASAASTTYTVNIGAKIGMNLAAGNYQGTVIFSTVANPIIVEEKGTWDTIKTMQEMTPEICANATIGATKVLQDTRNKVSYSVAKLRDGNCWMQQFLTLDLGIAATPSDTDISTDMTLDGSYWHVGSFWYYNWSAATAKSSATATAKNAEAQDSICPKGWQIPLAGELYDSTSGSFNYLLIKELTENGKTITNSSVVAKPLSFQPNTGFYNGGVSYTDRSYAWSRISAGSSAAYVLYYAQFNGSVSPNNINPISYGTTMRCLARQVAR